MIMFQSTHPHGVRLRCAMTSTEPLTFQSTHPHGVRPISKHRKRTHKDVSIHAPTRGATRAVHVIHQGHLGFNPRTHTGCDPPRPFIHVALVVSIHAPTRGATCVPKEFFRTGIVSIHAPTRGATGRCIASGMQ